MAFDFARAQAALISGAAPANPSAPGTGSGNLQQASSKGDRVNGLTTRIADLDTQIAKAPASQRTALTAHRKELQSELDLAKEIQTTLQNLLSFSGSAGSITGGLGGRIDELENSLPEARHQKGAATKTPGPTAATAAQPAPVRTFQPESAGILALAAELFSIHSGRQRVQDLARETDTLSANIDRLRKPLVDEARASINRGDEIASAATSETPDKLARGAGGAGRADYALQADLRGPYSIGRARHRDWNRSRKPRGIGGGL